jgi:hypothetical protein
LCPASDTRASECARNPKNSVAAIYIAVNTSDIFNIRCIGPFALSFAAIPLV